jgi:large subunit ribosomal protein L5
MSDQPRLKVKYQEEVHAKLMEQLGLENPMQVPTLEKIVLNMGLGEAMQDK